MTLHWKRITVWPPDDSYCLFMVRGHNIVSFVTGTATFGGWSHYIRIEREVWEEAGTTVPATPLHITEILSSAKAFTTRGITTAFPCYHLHRNGNMCGRSRDWPGHHHTTYPEDHPFIPLETLLEQVYNLRIEK